MKQNILLWDREAYTPRRGVCSHYFKQVSSILQYYEVNTLLWDREAYTPRRGAYPYYYEPIMENFSTPSSIRFHDEDARKDFSEKFSRRGVHSECRVILADFADTNLPTIIHNRGCESLCDVPVTCPTMLIQEFYSNMHGFNFSVPLFSTRIRGMRIVVTSQLVMDVLHVPRVEHPDYLDCECLRIVSKDKMISAFYEHPADWGNCQFIPCQPFAKGSNS